MTRNKSEGFVGILVVIIGAIAVGGVFYYINENSKSTKYVPTDISDQAAMAYGSQIQDTATTTATTTELLVVDEKEENETKAKATSAAMEESEVKITPSPLKPTPQPTKDPEPVLEPALLVTEGERLRPTLLLGSSYDVQFTIVRLTAVKTDVEITGLTIERKGFASDRIFTEIGIEGIDVERTPNSNHQYITREAFTIKAGETREIVLFGNITDQVTLADYDGQTPSLALVNIETNTKITGQLPITGTTHTANSSLTIGSATLSSSGFDPGQNKTIYINSNNIIFTAVRVDVGSAEPILIKSFGFTQNGSASAMDLANLQICVDHRANLRCYPTESEDSKFFSSEFEDDIMIPKGESADIYIKGDVLTTGSSRTINFDVQTSADLLGYGLTYKNYILGGGGDLDGVQPEGSFSTSWYPFYNAYSHTISAGTFNSIGR